MRLNSVIILFLLGISILYTLPAYPEIIKKKRIAVMNFTADAELKSTARIVRNHIELNLYKSKRFDIIESSQIDIILKARNQKAAEYTDEDCARKLGDILKSDYVVIGSIDKMDKLIINIKVVDVKEKRVLITDSYDADEITKDRKISRKISKELVNKIVKASKKKEGVKEMTPVFSGRYSFLYPIGYLAKYTTMGHGGYVSAGLENIIVNNFLLGFEVGYLYFSGRNNTHHMYMVPVAIHAGYNINVWRFTFLPLVSLGIVYNVNYFYPILASKYTSRSGLQPIVKGALSVLYNFNRMAALSLGGEYAAIFEKTGSLMFLSFNAGFTIKF